MPQMCSDGPLRGPSCIVQNYEIHCFLALDQKIVSAPQKCHHLPRPLVALTASPSIRIVSYNRDKCVWHIGGHRWYCAIVVNLSSLLLWPCLGEVTQNRVFTLPHHLLEWSSLFDGSICSLTMNVGKGDSLIFVRKTIFIMEKSPQIHIHLIITKVA